jgi:hypothetical protein
VPTSQVRHHQHHSTRWKLEFIYFSHPTRCTIGSTIRSGLGGATRRAPTTPSTATRWCSIATARASSIGTRSERRWTTCLRAWLGVVLPRVPRTHELAVWFRVCFDAFDTNNAARTEQRVVRSARAVNAIEQEITALVERPSDQEVGQTHWLDMFAVVRRSTGDVSLRTPAPTDATDGGRGGGSSVPARPTSRGRGRPAGSGHIRLV